MPTHDPHSPNPWRHLAALTVAVLCAALVAAGTHTPAQTAILPLAAGFWAALMLQIAAGCYDRWL